ncbi:MAG: cell division protein ZapA [Bacteroidales bacterium]|nr:cell division protein ZapA [Bacteroidales bacterium]
MEDKRKSITIYIAQQPFKLLVTDEQEELYRKAEDKISQYIKSLASKQITDRFTQMGYALINFAIKETYLTEKQHYIDTDLKKSLKNLQSVLLNVISEMEAEE